jgi:uncharacterized membrane protein YczE
MSAAPRRAVSARVALVLVGSLISSFGYLMTAEAEVGNGPMFVVQDALHQRSGMPLGLTAVVAGLALAALAAALGSRFEVGVVAIPLLTGVTVALLEPIAPHADGVVWRWVSFGTGTAVMMLGAVVMLGGGFGASALDSAMFAVARVARTSPARARMGLEVAMALVGVVAGGRAGVGTVAMALTVGPLFAFWVAVLEPSRWSRDRQTRRSLTPWRGPTGPRGWRPTSSTTACSAPCTCGRSPALGSPTTRRSSTPRSRRAPSTR